MVQSEVKRYSIVAKDDDWDMWWTNNGWFVEYTDYAALERERDELKEELRKWRDSRDGMMSIVEELEAENARLQKEVLFLKRIAVFIGDDFIEHITKLYIELEKKPDKGGQHENI